MIKYESTYAAWIEAFQIFAKYEPELESISAEHDCIWAGPDIEDISAEDLARLEELGWSDHEEVGRCCHYV